ncbi:DUF2382 domain-containing protein [Chroococcidiopsis sp.]|uniref:DUF2382 domain-containing protein n=1 Tax=Chroococcidiopsis sp. TaxID=3088168 RepID=UPI003F3DF5DA
MIEDREIQEDREIKFEPNTGQTEIHAVDADKSNGLAQLAIGGIVGAAMGTIAAILTDKNTANTLNRTAKDLGNVVKGTTESVNNTIKNGVETVKNKAFDLNKNISKNSKQKVEKETENSSASVENLAARVKETVKDANPSNSQAERTSDVQVFYLYEERIAANKKQVKTGEIAIGKHIETHIAQISVPLEKERLVIEQIPADDETPVALSEADFKEGELVRIELYEQIAEVEKKAFVREQVRVRKEVEHKALEVEEEIRREELDLDIQDRNDSDNLPVKTVDKDKISQQVTQVERTDLIPN